MKTPDQDTLHHNHNNDNRRTLGIKHGADILQHFL